VVEQIPGLFQKPLNEETIKYGFDYLDAYRTAALSGTNKATYPTYCGRLSTVFATANRVVVHSSHSNLLSLSSGVDTDGVLSSSIFTRDNEGNKYDLDFSGPQFYDSFMSWFSICGTEINEILSNWSPSSSNTRKVIELTRNGFTLEEAIPYTWSARQAARHGFANFTHDDTGPLETCGLGVIFTR